MNAHEKAREIIADTKLFPSAHMSETASGLISYKGYMRLIEAMSQSLIQTRDEALEEAAEKASDVSLDGYKFVSRDLPYQIRALKSKKE